MKKIRPTLTVLVGLPGNGKSTYAQLYANKYDNVRVVSSDEVREYFYGDASVQDDPKRIFKEVNRRVRGYLISGFDVIYDATNLTLKIRRGIISEYKEIANIDALVFLTPINVCKENNAHRTRKVPEEVIDRMMGQFTPPMRWEGFRDVHCRFVEEENYPSCLTLMEKMKNFNQHNHHHTLMLYEHCDKCAKYIMDHVSRQELVSAAMYHDCGKTEAHTVDENGEWHYYNHGNISSYLFLTSTVGDYLTDEQYYIGCLIAYHMYPYFKDWDKTKDRFNELFVRDLELLHAADVAAH